MTRSGSASYLGSEFNDFLFAPIEETKSGMPLSVLSALARLDVDPWQEAAELSLLPCETAIQRLASLIRALPEGSSTDPDDTTAATRLIAFLPHTYSAAMPAHNALRSAVTVVRSPMVFLYVMLWFAFIAGAQFINEVPNLPQNASHSRMPSKIASKAASPESDR